LIDETVKKKNSEKNSEKTVKISGKSVKNQSKIS